MNGDAEIVRETYNDLGPVYDLWAASVRRDERRKYEALIKTRLAPGASILDVGCGNGLLQTRELSAKFRVVGVDISERQIREAKHNVPQAVFLCADIRECTFAPNSFDGIVSFYCFNHLARASYPALFGKLHDWLKPGGLLIAAFGTGDNEAWVGEWLGTTTFFSSYKREETLSILVAAGFLIEDAAVESAEENGQEVSFLWVSASKGNAKWDRNKQPATV